MAKFQMFTKTGYNFYDMSSLLQKAIRRGDLEKAGFALKELLPKYAQYVWKRLLTISAEDCYGIITKEIVALQQVDEWMKKKNRGNQESIFAAKAVVLLCLARKNRDACYVACNFMDPDRTMDPDEIQEYIIDDEVKMQVPDYAYDCHTYTGKKNGRDILDMIRDEQEALYPKQLSLFDNGDWDPYIKTEQKAGNLSTLGQKAKVRIFQEGKETDPTHGGKDWPEHEENWGRGAR